MATFDVRGFSFTLRNVPPKDRLFDSSYSQFKPTMVFRMEPYSLLSSRLTLILVPASKMLWLMMVTSPPA